MGPRAETVSLHLYQQGYGHGVLTSVQPENAINLHLGFTLKLDSA